GPSPEPRLSIDGPPTSSSRTCPLSLRARQRSAPARWLLRSPRKPPRRTPSGPHLAVCSERIAGPPEGAPYACSPVLFLEGRRRVPTENRIHELVPSTRNDLDQSSGWK